MLRKQLLAVPLGLVVLTACEPTIPHTPPPGSVASAIFDPASGRIPLPNDLAFFNPPNSVCPNTASLTAAPACAQAELLATLNGLFPSDQEVAVTIDFTQTNFAADGSTTQVAPDLDLTTFTPSTFFVYGATGADQGEVAIEPLTSASYVKLGDHGTLTLHHLGRTPWAPGSYAVLVRGGDSGVHTTDKIAISPSPVFDLVAQGLDMTDPKNLGLLKAQAGSTAAAVAQGQQLNQVIKLYKMMAFPVADTRFPHQELAIATTFRIAPAVTNVTIDAARGLVPLPIDLLRDPTSGKLSALAACTLAGSSLATDGTCPNAAAAGFQALDGFATTGAILAPTSDLVAAVTVTPASLQLYDLTDPKHPAQVDPSTLIIEPCEFTSACGSPLALSPVIAIQPAGVTSGDPSSVFRTRPLKDATDYAVVMTTAILDKAGNPIGPGTVAKIVGFSNKLVVGGHSALLGIDDVTAASLEKMRLQLAPVFTAVVASGVARGDIAMAYTFHTQTIISQAIQLAAGPYTAPAITATPQALTVEKPVDAFTKFGVDQTLVPGTNDGDNIDEILETTIFAFDALDPATGAFLADPTKAAPEFISVLIATPKASNPKVPACTGALAPFGKCAPLMVFRHGLGSGRADMLTVADANAAAGMVTVAIDAAKHGDRSFCTSGTTGPASGCAGANAACTTALPAGAQGDVHPPGTCGGAGFIKAPVSPTCTGDCATNATDGIPVVSGNYLISANLFRTRDTMRQDLLDQSQLIRVMAFVPSGAPPTGHSVFDHMATHGVIIDPATVYFSGQSLGAIQGAMDVAANPRISKAGFNVGGGTIVDLFDNSPAFTGAVNQLLAGLGIQRGTSAFLQFQVVAKTVLDPADPVNFMGHLTANPLPNLLSDPTGKTLQSPKKILTQIANCDGVVPNPFNLLYASNVPTGPLPTGPSFFAGGTGNFEIFISTQPPFTTFGSCPASAVEHAFYTDWVTRAITSKAQQDLASFVMQDALPPSVQHP